MVEAGTIQTIVNLSGLVVMTGTIIWHNGRTEGKRAAREDDLYRRMLLAEQWQVDKGATRGDLESVQAGFHEALKSLLESVNTRMSGVEDQVKELRTYMMRNQEGN